MGRAGSTAAPQHSRHTQRTKLPRCPDTTRWRDRGDERAAAGRGTRPFTVFLTDPSRAAEVAAALEAKLLEVIEPKSENSEKFVGGPFRISEGGPHNFPVPTSVSAESGARIPDYDPN